MTEVRDMSEFPEWLDRIRDQERLSVVAHHHRGRRVNREDWREMDGIWQMWFENTVWLSPFPLHLKLSCVCVCGFVCTVAQTISSVAQLSLTLCDATDCSTPGLLVHHQLPEFTQTHVNWVSDAIQPSHPLSSHSPPAPNPCQHQGLFKWVSSSHQVAKVLEFQLPNQLLSHFQFFVAPWTAARQILLSMGFPKQEYWSGLPFPPSWDLPNPGIEPMSPALLHYYADSLPLSHLGSPKPQNKKLKNKNENRTGEGKNYRWGRKLTTVSELIA